MSNNMKVFALVALVVIMALIGINRSGLALSAGNLLAEGSRLGCCGRGGPGTPGTPVEEPRRSFGGGCCSGGALGGQDALSEEELRSIGLQFYGENVPGANLGQVTAQVLDFGCHQEIHIYQEGVLILKVGYSYGQAYRIP